VQDNLTTSPKTIDALWRFQKLILQRLAERLSQEGE
jgi:hypothetical protein